MKELGIQELHFIEKAFTRVRDIKKILITETQLTTRLLYYKELYSIFTELYNISSIKRKKWVSPTDEKIEYQTIYGNWDGNGRTAKVFEKPSPNMPVVTFQAGFMNDMIDIIKFIRNVLSHFPLFPIWDDIWISPVIADELSPNGKSSITAFLTEPKFHTSITLTITNVGSTIIKYPILSSYTDVIYLKDIVDEANGALIVIQIMESMFSDHLKANTDYYKD